MTEAPAAGGGLFARPLPSRPGRRDTDPMPSLIRCRHCRRPVHDPLSRMWAMGPECRRRWRVRIAPTPPRSDVQQDALPGM